MLTRNLGSGTTQLIPTPARFSLTQGLGQMAEPHQPLHLIRISMRTTEVNALTVWLGESHEVNAVHKALTVMPGAR